MRALLSVYDKSGLVEFARALHGCGFELVSTGGTHRALVEDGGLPARQVAELTGSPEILDGRVKTLHPMIHGGILARREVASHTRQLAEHGIGAIDLVAVNLYPFVETVRRPGVTLEEALENIDIGGPTLLRAAAKNFPHVIAVSDPGDYDWIAARLSQGTGSPASAVSPEERRALALKAFQHVAVYDTAVSQYLSGGDILGSREVTLGFRKLASLRYGENPHQAGGLYSDVLAEGGVAGARQLHGRDLSFNNILDADAAWGVVSDFDEPAAAVIKHTNPCGLAVHRDQATAYRRALAGDPVSAYGGIVGFNRAVTGDTARAMAGVFYEVVVAPSYDPDALETLAKRKNVRVLEVPPSSGSKLALDIRRVAGGALIQTADALDEDPAGWRVATQRRPTDGELADLSFAWKAVKHVKSNAIVLARDAALLGMGAGQPNRLTSIHLALRVAGDRARGAVMASDAFMPFTDNVELAAKGGVAAIVQPGGSIRDAEVIAEADRHDVAMVFTGVRHFRH